MSETSRPLSLPSAVKPNAPVARNALVQGVDIILHQLPSPSEEVTRNF